MKLAIEQVGSRFTGWISSCLPCFSTPSNDNSGKESVRYHDSQRAVEDQGRCEREREICYDQPPLVPPMAQAAFGRFSVASAHSRTRPVSLPARPRDGRNRASRAPKGTRMSNRASGLSYKRRSARPVSIGAPSNFRRVEPTFSQNYGLGRFQPLELSIHRPENRVSDFLSKFEEFQLNDERQSSAPAPGTLVPASFDIPRPPPQVYHEPEPDLFQLPRKPIGAASRHFSLASPDPELEKRTSFAVKCPLIPHFSTRTPHSFILISEIAMPSLLPIPNQLKLDEDQSFSFGSEQHRREEESWPLKPSPFFPTESTADLQDSFLPPQDCTSSTDCIPQTPPPSSPKTLPSDCIAHSSRDPPPIPSSPSMHVTHTGGHNHSQSFSVSSLSSSSDCPSGGTNVSHSYTTSTTSTTIAAPVPSHSLEKVCRVES